MFHAIADALAEDWERRAKERAKPKPQSNR